MGAKMVAFGGWEMPLSYPGGTIAEHLACRSAAVVFDVSHLGSARVQGPHAFARLQSTLTNDLQRIKPGRAQYSHLLDPVDASVQDDVIVWWLDSDLFEVMPNASNTSRVCSALDGVDVTSGRAILAVQGPDARRLLATLSPEAAAVGRFEVGRFVWRASACVAAGTGYTGEDGVELSMPVEVAPHLWRALIEAGIGPAGLGARDTLRLEAALPLHGHELGPGITPLQAGLGWVVRWDKPEGFLGREALMVERESGVTRRLFGLAAEGRQPPRHGSAVAIGGRTVGLITSGNFSPVLGRGIALAFLPPDTPLGQRVTVDMRGREVAADVVALPFVARRG